jgi:two-component system sensor histidine kinase PilS (NtrC family)
MSAPPLDPNVHDQDQESTRPAQSSASWFGDIDQVPTRAPAPPAEPSDQSSSSSWWRRSIWGNSQQSTFDDGLTRPAQSEGTTSERLYRAFLAARAALGSLLVVGMLTSNLLEHRTNPQILIFAVIYTVAAAVWWWWPAERKLRGTQGQYLAPRQALATIGVDLGSFALLSVLDWGLNLNTGALMALPVLMGSALMPRFLALGTAAAATLILLAGALFDGLLKDNFTSSLTPAGLTGFGLFAVALIVSELSSRLAREQRSARGNMALARQQAQLNRLVIEEMPEGVLVVDRQGRVRTANPSARRLLSAHGLVQSPPFQLRGVPAWEPLVRTIEQAFSAPTKLEDSREILLTFDDQTRRGLRMRLKFTRANEPHVHDDVCVVFLEDLRTVQARVRQDKLAAMGRMSAGVAHEIRNPLAAIAQANALMAEDAVTPGQKKLTTMVTDNVQRLKRIVDDILEVAPGIRPAAPVIDLERSLRAVVNDWLSLHPDAIKNQLLKLDTLGLPPRELGAAVAVRFEPEHLRRVMINLLDNALRHGKGQAGAIAVTAQWLQGTEQTPHQIEISVFSDGAPIEGDNERSLFEPFFSTRSRGTGLGLYICRELCERHSATIDYRSHPPTERHRNEFYILLPVTEPLKTAT